MIRYFSEIGRSSWAIIKGLRITLKYMFKPGITTQYPLEKLKPSPMFRGTLDFNKETCTACLLCVKACPSECIELEPQVNEAGKRIAKVKWYTIDFGKCNYCRLCQEACPTKPEKSVFHTDAYDLLFESRADMVKSWKNP